MTHARFLARNSDFLLSAEAGSRSVNAVVPGAALLVRTGSCCKPAAYATGQGPGSKTGRHLTRGFRTGSGSILGARAPREQKGTPRSPNCKKLLSPLEKGLLGQRRSESSPVEQSCGASQLPLEPPKDAETASGKAKRDRRLQPTARAGGCAQGHETDREGRSAASLSHLPVSLLASCQRNQIESPLARDWREEFARSLPQHHRTENRRVDLGQ